MQGKKTKYIATVNFEIKVHKKYFEKTKHVIELLLKQQRALKKTIKVKPAFWGQV